jgi:hypothetical protein
MRNASTARNGFMPSPDEINKRITLVFRGTENEPLEPPGIPLSQLNGFFCTGILEEKVDFDNLNLHTGFFTSTSLKRLLMIRRSKQAQIP